MRLVETNGGPVEVRIAPGLVGVDVEPLAKLAERFDPYRAHGWMTSAQARAFGRALIESANEADGVATRPTIRKTERGTNVHCARSGIDTRTKHVLP